MLLAVSCAWFDVRGSMCAGRVLFLLLFDAVCRVLFVVRCLSFVVWRCMLLSAVINCLMCDYCSLFVAVRVSLLVARCSLFVGCCVLRVVCWLVFVGLCVLVD